MSLIEVKKTFSQRELMWFGPLFALFLGLICYFILWKYLLPQATYAVAGLGGLVILIYYLVPSLRTPIYRGWLYSVLPIGFVISHIILAAVFYILFTTIGLIMRIVGYDPMCRKLDRAAASYWIARPPQHDSKSYFRQY